MKKREPSLGEMSTIIAENTEVDTIRKISECRLLEKREHFYVELWFPVVFLNDYFYLIPNRIIIEFIVHFPLSQLTFTSQRLMTCVSPNATPR